jgi:hypothetical protein
MIGVLTFTLPEDEVEWKEANQAGAAHAALAKIADLFRSHRKYDAPAVDEPAFLDVLSEYGIDLW